MKKLNLLFIAITLVLTSCSSDDSKPEVSGDIVGTWDMVDYSYTGTTVTKAQGQTLSADFIGSAYNINSTITFEENPNNIISEGSFSLELTTTVSGQTSVSHVHNLESVSGGTWELVNGELRTNSNGQTGNMKIEKLTESSLVLAVKEKQDLSQSGVSIVSDINAKVYFERK